MVLYLVVGQWRVPWSFRVWRGKGTDSPARLGLKLVKSLPSALTKHFRVMILADTRRSTRQLFKIAPQRAANLVALSFCMVYASLNITLLLVSVLTVNWSMGVSYDIYTNGDSKYGVWV